MTLHINSSTLMGFNNNTATVFFGENARKASKVLDRQTETNSRGIEYLLIPERQRDVVYPKLVKAGYKLAILDD